MADYLYHREPDTWSSTPKSSNAAPARVQLDRSFLHPGGGARSPTAPP
jgi:hypothetical protein